MVRSQKTIRGGARARRRRLERLARRSASRPKCPNGGKACFSSEAEALGALTRIASAEPSPTGKKPVRVYRCPSCGDWHLTSMPKGGS